MPSFTDSTLADFSTDVVYTDEVSADGFPAATYTVSAGTLPAGVTLDPTTGELTGTPTGIEAPYSFEITASNFVGSDSVTFTGTVHTGPRSFTDGEIQELVIGSPVTDGVTANGFPAPTYSITSGSLPAGLTLDPTTGAITGTPTVPGLYSFEVTATNSEGSISKTLAGRVYREDRGYLGLNPGRLFDSRDTDTPVEAGSVTEVTVIGRFGVPLDARAAVLNVTVTDAGANGFATVYPCGTERQLVSNLNFVTGETVSNSVTTVLGTDGKICIFTTAGTHLVVDVNGAFSPTQGQGQLLPLAPSRLFDSRDTDILLAAGSITELEVTGHGGVPANAGAVVLNVTVTGPIGAGYVTVYPCGSERPLASNVNFLAGKTVPRAVIAAVGEQGRVCVFTSAATHLVVDINGAFSLDGEGRFQGITPHRLLDTREGSKPAAGAIQVLTIGGQGSIPANTMAVVLNVTLTESDSAWLCNGLPMRRSDSARIQRQLRAGSNRAERSDRIARLPRPGVRLRQRRGPRGCRHLRHLHPLTLDLAHHPAFDNSGPAYGPQLSNARCMRGRSLPSAVVGSGKRPLRGAVQRWRDGDSEGLLAGDPVEVPGWRSHRLERCREP